MISYSEVAKQYGIKYSQDFAIFLRKKDYGQFKDGTRYLDESQVDMIVQEYNAYRKLGFENYENYESYEIGEKIKEEEKRRASTILTTGVSVEGYKVTKYLGIVTGESALGTGFLSSMGAGIADFLGTNSGMYSDKLKKAKDHSLTEMTHAAWNVGANAIIGIDIDYTSFSGDIMGVICTGTAVWIEPEE